MQRGEQESALAALSDDELVRRCKENDEEAFRLLMNRCFLLLKKRAADYAVRGAEAEDLMQEGLIALHNATRTYDENGKASFRHYADVCISNRLCSIVRHVYSGKNKVNTLTEPIEEAEGISTGTADDPQDTVIRQEELAMLEQYLHDNLTKIEGQVLSCYLDGLSYEAIARKLSISRKSCDNAMQRVRRKLRLALMDRS